MLGDNSLVEPAIDSICSVEEQFSSAKFRPYKWAIKIARHRTVMFSLKLTNLLDTKDL